MYDIIIRGYLGMIIGERQTENLEGAKELATKILKEGYGTIAYIYSKDSIIAILHK